MRVVRFLLAILIASFTTGVAEAQQGAASIRGNVVDQGQLVLPGVAVTVTHAESGTVRETVSAADGI